MTTEERKEKVALLRKYHEETFAALGHPEAYLTGKLAYVPDGKDSKYINLYESELSKGDVYVEFTTFEYDPVDASRMLYKLDFNSDWKSIYEPHTNKNGVVQYIVPVSDLKVVSPPLKDDETCIVPPTLKQDNFTKTHSSTEVIKEEMFKDEFEGTHIVRYLNGEPVDYLYHGKSQGTPIYLDTQGMIQVFKFLNQLRNERKQ